MCGISFLGVGEFYEVLRLYSALRGPSGYDSGSLHLVCLFLLGTLSSLIPSSVYPSRSSLAWSFFGGVQELPPVEIGDIILPFID